MNTNISTNNRLIYRSLRAEKSRTLMKKYYSTKLGHCYNTTIEDFIASTDFKKLRGKVSLIFTSPPFPLKRKKKYGNKDGEEYVNWLTSIMTQLKELLTDDGSLVIEIGNSWEKGVPEMSTLPLETLLEIKKKANLKLCQQFIWHNTAKLPSPAQWVNVERIRVKDSFTNIWWMAKTSKPKANNKKVLAEYSDSMKKLLKTGKYNAGTRPSEHVINETSFLSNNNGAIPSSVISCANTSSSSKYLKYCKDNGYTLHPATMPPLLVEFFINFLTDEGDLVFDPFGGSLTTGEIAEKLKREWICTEADEKYLIGAKGRFIS